MPRKTETAEYQFVAKGRYDDPKDPHNNKPATIALEPMSGDLSVLSGGHMAIHLDDDATDEQARELARLLNVKKVSYTKSKR